MGIDEQLEGVPGVPAGHVGIRDGPGQGGVVIPHPDQLLEVGLPELQQHQGLEQGRPGQSLRQISHRGTPRVQPAGDHNAVTPPAPHRGQELIPQHDSGL